MKIILLMWVVLVTSGCTFLDEKVKEWQMYYLKGDDMIKETNAIPDILKPPVLGPIENPDKD